MIKNLVLPYFPKPMKYATPFLFSGGIFLLVADHPVWATLLVLLSIIILTTNYVTEINLNERSFDDYLLLLWIPLNRDRKRFKLLKYISITKGNHAQTVNTRAQSRQVDWSDFTATLLFDNDSLDLITNTNKKELLYALREFSDFLKVDVQDNTSSSPYWIDMSKY